MVKGLYVLKSFDVIYGEAEREDVAKLIDIYAPPQTPESVKDNPSILRDAEVILTGWGGPKMDEEFLAAAPKLRAVFYGAGSVRGIVTDAFWDRNIVLCSSWAANAVPVTEYLVSQILFCLKKGWHYVRWIREGGAWWQRAERTPGACGSTVAAISLGMIGRRVCRLLQPYELKIIACTGNAKLAAELNIERVSLADAFRRGDVVSLHTPLLDETRGMITGEHFASMKPHASFINTARGAVVREKEMIEVLRRRPDLQAVLDVTEPEPPEPGSALYTLPNVALTPHIAGAMGDECHRMGRYMVEELRRYLHGEPLQWAIDREKAARLA